MVAAAQVMSHVARVTQHSFGLQVLVTHTFASSLNSLSPHWTLLRLQVSGGADAGPVQVIACVVELSWDGRV